MSKVFSPSIFLTSSREVIDKLFFGKVPSVDIENDVTIYLTKEEQEKSLISTPSKNNGLIDFELSWGSAGAEQMGLSLTFIDSNNDFEQQYIESNGKIILLKKIVSEFRTNSKFTNNTNLEKIKTNALLEDYLSIYCSFGVGSDVSTWAGPYKIDLVNAKVKIDSNGVKRVILEFNSFSGYLQSNSILADLNNSRNQSVARFNKIISLGKIVEVRSKTLINIKEERGKDLFSGLPSPIEDLFAKKLRSCIEDYIKIISGSQNVFLFLPNLRFILHAYISNKSNDPIVKDLNDRDSKSIILFQKFCEEIGMSFTEDFSKKKFTGSLVPTPFLREQVKNGDPPENYVLGLGINTLVQVNDSINAFFPDYAKILFIVIENLFGLVVKYWQPPKYAPNTYILVEQTDLKYLNLLKGNKLLSNNKDTIYIFGPKEVVNDLVYCDSVKTLGDALKDSNIDFDLTQEQYYLQRSEYRLKYFNTFKRLNSNSSFGENTLLNDLSLDNNIKYKLEAAAIEGYPVFRCGIANSNVLSLTLDIDAGAIAAFNFGFGIEATELRDDIIPLEVASTFNTSFSGTQSFEKLTAASLSPLQKDLNDKVSFNEIYKLVLEGLSDKDWLETLSFDEKLIKFAKGKSVKYLAFIIACRIYTNDDYGVYVKHESFKEFYTAQSSFIEELNNYAINLTIKTLPFFNIIPFTAPKCFVIHNPNKIVGSTKRPQTFTGLYQIKGCRHVINTNECYSEFNLCGRIGTETVDPILADLGSTLENKAEERKKAQDQVIAEKNKNNIYVKALRFFNSLGEFVGLAPNPENK